MENRTFEDLLRDTVMQDVLLRRIEVLGEITKRFPNEFKENYSNVPWASIAGTRDVIAHDYDGIDFKKVWEIAKEDVPEFYKEVIKMLEDVDKKISS